MPFLEVNSSSDTLQAVFSISLGKCVDINVDK